LLKVNLLFISQCQVIDNPPDRQVTIAYCFVKVIHVPLVEFSRQAINVDVYKT
jgi:hypothetical protein